MGSKPQTAQDAASRRKSDSAASPSSSLSLATGSPWVPKPSKPQSIPPQPSSSTPSQLSTSTSASVIIDTDSSNESDDAFASKADVEKSTVPDDMLSLIRKEMGEKIEWLNTTDKKFSSGVETLVSVTMHNATNLRGLKECIRMLIGVIKQQSERIERLEQAQNYGKAPKPERKAYKPYSSRSPSRSNP